MIRQLLSAPPALRTTLVAYPRTLRTANIYRSYSSTIPGVSQPSFWTSLIPKPLRRGAKGSNPVKKPKSKEWNPATFYIIIFLLIGSMSIQMIALRNESEAFGRRADAKLELLREVIERVQNGEDVDVEGLLGTGNKKQEKEWTRGILSCDEACRHMFMLGIVLEEIQSKDDIWKQRRKEVQSPANSDPKTSTIESDLKTKVDAPTTPRPVQSNAPKGFY